MALTSTPLVPCLAHVIDLLSGGTQRAPTAPNESGFVDTPPQDDTMCDAGCPGEHRVLHTRVANTDAADRVLGAVRLLPHQVNGARRLRAIVATHGGALLADEVGLGKTYTALQLARESRALLIVSPAALRDMWRAACARCGIVAEGVSYEGLSRGVVMRRAGGWSMVILDEAHHARSPCTRRYQALAELTRGAQVLLVTATPIHNRRRDLTALLALFLGAGAAHLDAAALSGLVVRRRVHDVGHALPTLAPLTRHAVPRADRVLAAIRGLPPPVPPADGGLALALVSLQLTRAWCSSDAALLAALRRRLATAAAVEQSLECNRLPSRRDLRTWTADPDGSVQLAFPQFVAGAIPTGTTADAVATVRAHAAALRALRTLVRGEAARDHARFQIVARIVAARGSRQVVVFTQSTESALAASIALRATARVALLTGRGAWMASGRVTRREVLAQFAPHGIGGSPPSSVPPTAATGIDVLIATDVVSEGVDLQHAAIVIHLDLPWTVARLEQRMGRVRRLGSRHARVEAHLVTPPIGARELDATLAHLARKAALTESTIGWSSLLGHASTWGDFLPAMDAGAPAAARDAQLAVLRQLMQLALRGVGSSTAERSASDVLRPVGSPAAVRWTLPGEFDVLAFALVTIDGVPRLVTSTSNGVTDDPVTAERALIRTLRIAQAPPRGADRAPAGLQDRSAPSVPSAPSATSAPDRLERQLRAWCRTRAAAQHIVPPMAGNSRAHRRVLQLLDALPSRAPRSLRAAMARRVEAARALVLRQHGIGVEQALEALAHRAPSAPRASEAAALWIDDVVCALTSTPGVHPSSPSHGSCRVTLEALLTILPTGTPG